MRGDGRPSRGRQGRRRLPVACRRAMSGPYDLMGAGAYAVVAVVWCIAAEDAWRARVKSELRSPVSLLLPLAATSMACFYALYACAALLLPPHSAERAPRWFDLTDVSLLAGLAC